MRDYSFLIFIVIYLLFSVLAGSRKKAARKRAEKPFDRFRGQHTDLEGPPPSRDAPGSRRTKDRLRERTAPASPGKQSGKGQPLSFDQAEQPGGKPPGKAARMGGRAGGSRLQGRGHQAPGSIAAQAAAEEKAGRAAQKAEKRRGFTDQTGLAEGLSGHPTAIAERKVVEIYEPDRQLSAADAFLSREKAKALQLTEGMIWSQVLSEPRCRRPMCVSRPRRSV